jgi:branched-chain amino acid transport system substrate-binding protein
VGGQGRQGAQRVLPPVGRSLALVLALLGLAGCTSEAGITRGGKVVGETLSVYTMLPLSGPRGEAARDAVRGQKLALFEAGGTAGPYKVNFAPVDLSGGRVKISNAVREAIHDVSIIAAVTDFDARTARITVPLFNAAGILQVSPGATYGGFVAPAGEADPDAPGRYFPSGHPTFAPLLPTTDAQAVALARAARGRVAIESEAGEASEALAAALHRQVGRTVATEDADTVVYAGEDPESAAGVVEAIKRENPRARILLPDALATSDVVRGRRVAAVTAAGPPDPDRDGAFVAGYERAFGFEPGPYALVGYRAMKGILGAVDAAGDDAGRRQAVIDEYFKSDPLKAAAEAPFWLKSEAGYEPL